MLDAYLRRVIAITALTVTAIAAGCDGPPADPDPGDDDAGRQADAGPPPPDGGTPAVHVLARPSRSSTIAISDDDAIVAMVNPEDGSISTFTTADNERLARLPTGREPSSVVIHPNGTTAYVANRADATVVRIEGIDGPTPTITATVEVGSEPTGLALSPTGARLFVAEHAEGSVGVIDTSTFERIDVIDSPENPFALAVTNDGDAEDGDELLLVPEFFGVPIEGAEATDASRTGLVRVYRLSDLEPDGPITLQPIDSGFGPSGEPTVMTSPNQLWSVTIQGGRAYVTSISASAAAPVRFNLNVQPVVYVVDIASRQEIRTGSGTTNLARRVADTPADGRLFLADTVDLAFIGDSGGIGYAASRGADVVQRVVFDVEADTVTIGSTRNLQIEVSTPPAGTAAGCLNPTGITTAHGAPRAYLNCWLSRRLGVVDLSTQSLLTTVESTAPPTNPQAIEIARGARFFHTARGRWSNNGWSSCASCHPGGLTDNITWSFAAGPRQTTSLDGSFSHGAGPQKQRVFNWTAIFDEVHDFERNTRDVSGGLGAVVNGDCSSLATQAQVALPGNLAQPVKELADAEDVCTDGDWDAIEAWIRALRPPRGRRFLDAAAVERGAALFGMPTASANNGGCVACHGGPGWTASRRFFTPSSAENAALAAAPFTPPPAWAPGWNVHTLQIAPQPAAADADPDAAGPPQVACVLRNVGTFGPDELEVRANGTRAQGAGGYNVPSLYGLNVGAPYLHHGAARTLEELFTDPRFNEHTRAGNPVFLTTGDVERQRADLIAFLRSIDATTPEQPLPPGFDGCPP
ncbi:MAG TPA: beta-propeller fold lactonase family protein [Sandaracinaceae bacterium]